MARTLIGNIKGKDGRGIASISKTGTTGSVDTYTIEYTDGTNSKFTVNNSDSVSLQRQIVPSASVESSATASQAYAAGDYVVVSGVLRKVTSAIAKGNAISGSNSTATTVGGELGGLAKTVGETDTWHKLYDMQGWTVHYTKRYDVLYVRVQVGALGSNWWKAGTLPVEYRPKMDFYAPLYNYHENACAGVSVERSGLVSMHSYQTQSSTVSWTVLAIPLW
jgi:hypothetical protein